MLINLLTGFPVMLLCLLLQAIFLSACLNQYARVKIMRETREVPWMNFLLLAAVMVLMLLANFAQMVIWAALFKLLGEFDQFSTALYHSAVNFVTLGYGDIVMSERWRMLGPIESANGILMFGVSTAVTTAAVMDIIKYNIDRMKRNGSR
ncbi:ion channel [Dyella soli]|uniref:Two pore domain potassium channel family protein n=1 Tax=Dyella soli TaxID=522319 RepID=A0A4R0YMS0_9GAMM|nr:ion channel [Dyella soli]TCI08827.1 two pore domain potassium channel family protein [Dyella soli]